MSQDPAVAEPAQESAPRLWASKAFRLLWAGQTVSMLGSNVSTVIIPLVAVVTLNATAFEVGLLGFFQTVPFLALSLFIGVVVDRVRRRPLLIIADFGRFAVMALIPLLAAFNSLNIAALCVCVLIAGVLTVFFDLAYFAYTPTLLPRELLLAGNSTLEMSAQVSGLAGPGIGGALIAAFRAPFVVLIDALSFLVSAVSLIMIKVPEPSPGPSSKPYPRQVVKEIGEGLKVLFGNRYLRPVVLNASAYNLASQMVLTLFVLYATRDLGMAPGWIGLIFAVGSLGGIAGSIAINKVAKRYPFGLTFIGSMLIVRAALPFVALVRGPEPVLVVGFAVIWFATLFGLVASNSCVMTLRQIAVANELRGRVNAGYRTLSFGMIPLGALLAGSLAAAIGVHATLVVAAILIPLSLLIVILSPIMRLKDVAEAAPQPTGDDRSDSAVEEKVGR